MSNQSMIFAKIAIINFKCKITSLEIIDYIQVHNNFINIKFGAKQHHNILLVRFLNLNFIINHGQKLKFRTSFFPILIFITSLLQ